MNGNVIKSFLVGLGFGVDDASLKKFNGAIASASLKVTALYTSIKLAATGIVYGISKISEGFEQMGYEYRIIAPAINKVLMLRREMLKAYAAAGINITKVVQQSVRLNFSLAKTKFAFEAIYKSVASRFFPLITKQSDIFREKLYKNMPKIQAALERFIKFIFKAFEATTELGTRLWSILTRVYDFFVKLDKETNGWSTIILGVVAAWKLLNLEFLATPLGMLIAGLVSLLALYDDFKTFQEGGESLFNWTAFLPVIEAMKTAASSLSDTLGNAMQVIFALVDALWKLFHLDFAGFWDRLKAGAESVKDTFVALWTHLKNLLSVAGALGSWAVGVFGDSPSNAAANIQPTTSAVRNPLGTNASSAVTNQKVDQQTQITVMGSADASAVGRAVAGEQGRVNFDMVRNMKGATR